MLDRKHFFDSVRASLFGGHLTQEQVEGIIAILDEWEAGNYCDDRHLAYMLATTYHETGKVMDGKMERTMQPISEVGKGRGRKYGQRIKMNGRPYADTMAIFYGRGFVQLTWYENYQKAGLKLGNDLLHNPELALSLPVATKILFAGMMEGWFTGKKLSDYFNGGKEDWVNARKIINGLDRAELIAGYGKKFYAALSHTA